MFSRYCSVFSGIYVCVSEGGMRIYAVMLFRVMNISMRRVCLVEVVVWGMNRVAYKIVRVYRESYRRAAGDDLTNAERFMEDVRQAFIAIFGETTFKRVISELAEYYGVP